MHYVNATIGRAPVLTFRTHTVLFVNRPDAASMPPLVAFTALEERLPAAELRRLLAALDL